MLWVKARRKWGSKHSVIAHLCSRVEQQQEKWEGSALWAGTYIYHVFVSLEPAQDDLTGGRRIPPSQPRSDNRRVQSVCCDSSVALLALIRYEFVSFSSLPVYCFPSRGFSNPAR